MERQQKLVLVVSVLASMVAAIDGFIVNIALPTISRSLGGGLEVQQWVVDAYLLTLGALILVAGSFSDLLGRKRVLALGLVWFSLTSLLCAAAPNDTFLIIARALQGVGGALIVPSSLALIISVFSGAKQGRAIGTWTAWLSIATVIGPLVGGFILAVASWRWIFAVNVLPIAGTLWILAQLKVDEWDRPSVKADVLGAILCAVGLGAPVYALIKEPSYGWGSGQVWPLIVVGICLLVVFVWHEAHTTNPMLPLSLFKVRNFSFGNIATMAIYAGLAVSSFIITITLQQVGKYSAFEASLATLPISVVMFLLSKWFGRLSAEFGPMIFMTIGPLIAASGFLLMLDVQQHMHYISEWLPGILAFALGLSITVAPLTTAVLGGVGTKHAGVASAVNNAVARVAGLLAVALIGIITGPHITISGFHRVLVLIASLLVAGAIVSAVGIRNRPNV